MEPSYNTEVDAIRQREYPHMSNGIYLDHSGATIYAKSTVDQFSKKMITNLYGNPHSENLPAMLSGNVVDEVRERTLRFLGADPAAFDLVFVANATAAIKLVAEAFRDLAAKTRARRFWYGFHKDAHTSLVGVRELAGGWHHCFEGDAEVDAWLDAPAAFLAHRLDPAGLGLLAYPGQSNMSGRKLPLAWAAQVRQSALLQNTYTLFDAAALAMTSSMEPVFRDPEQAPDFTCLSLYKIFGFPDLGALVVRKASGHILTLRKYFGGGTVTMVSTMGEQSWHRSKGLQTPTYKLHEGLEDGTLPFHSILALGEAIGVHQKLYRSMDVISKHTNFLVTRLYQGLSELRHGNGRPVCQIYSGSAAGEGGISRQGPVVAFNVMRANEQYVPYSDVERLANAAGIYIRSGGVCNPGGIFSALGYEPWMTERALSAGHHCGSHGIDVIQSLPTGIVRASVGAMTTRREVDVFVHFMQETFAEQPQDALADWRDSATLCGSSPRGAKSSRPSLESLAAAAGDYSALVAPFHEVRELPRPYSVLSTTAAAHQHHHHHHHHHQQGDMLRMSPMPDAFQSLAIVR